MKIIDLIKQKRNCIGQRYINLFDPWLILRPLTEVAYLPSSMDYDYKKWAQEKFERKNLRGLDIKKLEDGFGGIRFRHVMGFDYLSFKDTVAIVSLGQMDWIIVDVTGDSAIMSAHNISNLLFSRKR